MKRKSKISTESTWMRFDVTINVPGFPSDGGNALAQQAERAMRRCLVKTLPEGTELNIKETTE